MKNYLIPLIILILSVACNDRSNESGNTTEKTNGEIILSPEQVERAGIRWEKIVETEIANSVRATGYLEVPPNQRAVVSPMISGYVKEIRVLVGERVRKGQILASLTSPEFLELQQTYREVSSKISFLRDDFERNKQLMDEKINAKKEFLRSEADYLSALARAESVQQKLIMYGADPDRILSGKTSGTMYLRSPLDGEVSEIMMILGQFVDPQEELLEVVNPDHLHVELRVFESDLDKVANGLPVQFTLPQVRDRIFDGTIYKISNVIREKERSVRIHVHIDSEESDYFKIGAYVEAEIIAEEKMVKAVRERAIQSINGKQKLYLLTSKDPTYFQFREMDVTTGSKKDGWVEVIGMDTNSQYVSEGAYYLSGI